MERVVNKASSFKQADDWDVQQQISMTPRERIRAARELQRRVYGKDSKDVRECATKA